MLTDILHMGTIESLTILHLSVIVLLIYWNGELLGHDINIFD